MKTISLNVKRIKKMLGQTKIGLFKTEGIQSLLLPNNVVFISGIDELGYISFYTNFNKKRLALIDSNFYANLDFNEKDFERIFRLSGSTEIVKNEFAKKEDGSELILLRMKISRVEYQSNKKNIFEAVPKKINGWLRQLVSPASSKNAQVGFN